MLATDPAAAAAAGPLLFKAFLLGIVEALTEFLPISSTGHLVLFSHALKMPEEFAKTFDVFIQLGAVTALAIFYRRRLGDWVRGSLVARDYRPWINLGIAFLPAATVGFLLHKKIEALLMFPRPVALALIVGALALEIVERRARGATADVTQVTPRQALVVGLCQILSLWPGFSRSAATIAGGILAGMTTPVAVEFSFLVSIPTLGAATIYSLLKVVRLLDGSQVLLLATGAASAFVFSFPVLSAFLGYVQTRSMRPFVIYRIVLGAAVLYSFAG